jgi:hypothetical protein
MISQIYIIYNIGSHFPLTGSLIYILTVLDRKYLFANNSYMYYN